MLEYPALKVRSIGLLNQEDFSLDMMSHFGHDLSQEMGDPGKVHSACPALISRSRRSGDQAPSWTEYKGRLRSARPSRAGGIRGHRPTKLPASAPLRPESQGGAGPPVVNQSATRSRSWALSR